MLPTGSAQRAELGEGHAVRIPRRNGELSYFSPLHHSVWQREDYILSACLIRPRFGSGKSREIFWRAGRMEQDTERRNWGGIPGAEFGVLWFVVYSTVFMNGNELMIRRLTALSRHLISVCNPKNTTFG